MAVSVLQRVLSRWRPAPIATAGALGSFVQERAFFLAQKCAIDYCRGKTGLASYALFTEKPFLEALDVCRWETFAVILGDLLILVEAALRPQVGSEQRERLCGALADLHAQILSSMPAPAHRAQGWGDVRESVALRLRAGSAGAPAQALDVADHSAKRLFDTLPIHSSYRELDEEVVYGAVRFRMIAVNQELQRRLAPEMLAAELLA